MRIFKFGGASVKDAQGVQNVAKLLQDQGVENTLVVISAMGKMTNAFEELIDAYFYKTDDLHSKKAHIVAYHQKVMDDLFEKGHPVYQTIQVLFDELDWFLERNTSQRYNYVYDQIICFGELLSTRIVSGYLSVLQIENHWLDVRNYIKTDSNYRDAKVDWAVDTTTESPSSIDVQKLHITQGFLAGNDTENTTTLGREGSDYTAGILRLLLECGKRDDLEGCSWACSTQIREFLNDTTLLLTQISYEEAIEMAFYGASVIHPKTIQPLQNKEIPLYVKSFINPSPTHWVHGFPKAPIWNPYIPCFIIKRNQILVSISANDFSFHGRKQL